MRHGCARPLSLLLLLCALLALACQPRVLEVDLDRIARETDRNAAAALDRPEVGKGFDALMEGALADPALGEAGQKLLASLGTDPAIQGPAEAILGKLGESPAMKKLVTRLMRDNPKLSADRIGELAGKRVGEVAEGPLFDRAFDRAYKDLIARPEVEAAFHRLGDGVAKNPHVAAALRDTIAARVRDAQWLARLTALNGGRPPDRARATELLLEHALTADRYARFYMDVTALPSLRRALADALRELATTPAAQRQVAAALGECLKDETFQRSAVEVMEAMIDDAPTEASLYAALKRLIDTPVTSRALTSLLDGMKRDPEVSAIGARVLERMAADPGLRAAIANLCDGW